MRVFISWSGERARRMAEALDQWLPDVVQYVDAFFSPEDIAAGTRGDEELSKQIEAADFGITCLTPENVAAPWILYETGALAHKLKRRASPYLLDLTPAQVPPPLGKLQCMRADRDDTLKLLRSIEETAGEKAVGHERLERGFAQWWPSLEVKLQAIPKPAAVTKQKREPDEMMAEILETVRSMAGRRDEREAREKLERKLFTGFKGSDAARAFMSKRRKEALQRLLEAYGGGAPPGMLHDVSNADAILDMTDVQLDELGAQLRNSYPPLRPANPALKPEQKDDEKV